ncbi:Type 1 glutamine amidotransferase-like domain-containing protein [Luteipulveratus halotolerans]|uniref:Peptidase S51 n=1 Tax=Luteipulveratus halotolerans TaxID=1631356 RepID=A0A0L6CKM6_9MICO|nr:Type 1 glutamine amidotransferase-like domain-containing protein [Luteipulveratus halotolerans]KNX38294.1 peptidase S51 [Luteipulveratus halotolerans]
MRLLLTSQGVTNPSIRGALVDLLGKPVEEASALFVPTGVYPFGGGAGMAWDAMSGSRSDQLVGLGWRTLGVLELTALPTIRPEMWVPAVREADALLVWGGDVLYLTHWLRASGLADLFPSLTDTVYVGVSAGAIAVTSHNVDAEFDLGFVPDGHPMADDAEHGLGLVDFTVVPHLDHPDAHGAPLAEVEAWAATIPAPTYAIDDDTALTVVDGTVEVISEGSWKLIPPATPR